MAKTKTREQIVRQMQRQLAEVRQYFIDGEHWNSTHAGQEIDSTRTASCGGFNNN